MRTKGLAILALSVTMISATANADDSVKVKFRSGYPPPDRNSEMVELKVTRFAARIGFHEYRCRSYSGKR